ncbi:ankyrin repeat domain-containing protein [Holosporaceae bacterium 'Namur']|nr:ankyrin repeat domain-containing protein [Holosporaceae bacterium 'Namur']
MKDFKVKENNDKLSISVLRLLDKAEEILSNEDYKNIKKVEQFLEIIDRVQDHWEFGDKIEEKITTLHERVIGCNKYKEIEEEPKKEGDYQLDLSTTRRRLKRLHEGKKNKDLIRLCENLCKKGDACKKSEEYAEALKYYNIVLEYFIDIKNTEECRELLDNISKCYFKLKQYKESALYESIISDDLRNRFPLIEVDSILDIVKIEKIKRRINIYNLDKDIDALRIINHLEGIADTYYVYKEITRATEIYGVIIEKLDELANKNYLPRTEILDEYLKVFEKYSQVIIGEGINNINPIKYKGKEYKEILRQIRNESRDKLVNNEESLGGSFNTALIKLISDIVKDAVKCLGPSKYKYVVLGLGSLARKELCPYSDIELMIIYDEQKDIKEKVLSEADKEGIDQYFRALTEVIKIKIISLRETHISLEDKSILSKIKIGLSFDSTHFPYKHDGKRNLVGTVGELSDNYWEGILDENTAIVFSIDAAIQQDICIVYAKENSKELFFEYRKRIREIPQESIAKVLSQWIIDDTLRFKLEANKVVRRLADENSDNEKDEGIDVKDNLLRFPVLLANRLCMYEGILIDEDNTDLSVSLQKVDRLTERGYFSNSEGEGMKEWIRFAQTLRMKVHLNYRGNKEEVYLESTGVKEDYILSNDEAAMLRTLYENIMQPMYNRAQSIARSLTDGNQQETEIETLKRNKDSEKVANIMILKSKQLIEKYHETRDILYAEKANWYYEKAAEISLDITEEAWQNTILDLGVNQETSKDSEGEISLELIINNKIEKIYLKEEVIREYLKPENQEIEGRRDVRMIYHNGEYYHIKQLPEAPGIEYAVSSLSHLLLGYTTTPFSILAKMTIDGKTTPVLISKTVIGEKLSEKLESLEKIDEESYGLAFVRTLFTNPEDDQFGNNIKSNTRSPEGEIKSRLFCIDNDHGFLQDVYKVDMVFWKQFIHKSVVYCSKEKMESSIVEAVKQKIKKLTPQMLRQWLVKIKARDDENRKLFEGNLIQEHEVVNKQGEEQKLGVTIPMLLDEQLGVNICYRIMQLQDCLLEHDSHYSYVRLLNNIDIIVAAEYNKVLTNDSLTTTSEKFNKLSEGQYEELNKGSPIEPRKVSSTKSKYLGSVIQKVPSPKQMKEKSKCAPQQALKKLDEVIDQLGKLKEIREEVISGKDKQFKKLSKPLKEMVINGRNSELKGPFIDNIFEAIIKVTHTRKKETELGSIEEGKILEKQKAILEFIKQQKLSFSKLNLSNCLALTDKDLDYILYYSPDLLWLDISNCLNLNNNTLDIIASRCEKIETLYIGSNKKVIFTSKNKSKLSSLVNLNINHCKYIDYEILFKLISRCPKLKNLVFDGHKEIDQNGIAKELENLKRILNKDGSLIITAKEGNINLVNLLITAGISVDMSNSNKETALMWAAKNGHLEIVQILLEKKASIDVCNSNKETALIWAVKHKHLEIVRILLENEANLNLIDKNGYNPLMWATKLNCKEIIELILLYQINSDQPIRDTHNALILARNNKYNEIASMLQIFINSQDLINLVKKGKLEDIETLLEKEIDINARDKDGNTAILYALSYESKQEQKYKKIVSILKAKGAILSQNDNMILDILNKKVRIRDKLGFGRIVNSYPLMFAAAYGMKELTALLLLDEHTNVNPANKYGITPLMLAAEGGHKEIVESLIRRGANVNDQINYFYRPDNLTYDGNRTYVSIDAEDAFHSNRNGRSALIAAAEKGHTKIVKILLDAGANISDTQYGNTALMLATINGHIEIVKILLEKERKLRKEINIDRIVFLASTNGHKKIVEMLIEEVTNINITNEDRNTGLIIASGKGYKEIVEMLLEAKADIDFRGQDGNTALHMASCNDNKEIALLLAEYGANIQQKNNDNMTPVDLAIKHRYFELARILYVQGGNLENEEIYINKEINKELSYKFNLKLVTGYILEWGIKNNDYKLLRKLLHEVSNFKTKINVDFDDAIVLASMLGKKDIVEILLQGGVDVNSTDTEGNSILIIAVNQKDKELVKMLLAEGANINAKNTRGDTALSKAVEQRDKELVKMLLAEGANINTKNTRGDTALSKAVRLRYREIVLVLLEHDNIMEKTLNEAFIFANIIEDDIIIRAIKPKVDANNKEIQEEIEKSKKLSKEMIDCIINAVYSASYENPILNDEKIEEFMKIANENYGTKGIDKLIEVGSDINSYRKFQKLREILGDDKAVKLYLQQILGKELNAANGFTERLNLERVVVPTTNNLEENNQSLSYREKVRIERGSGIEQRVVGKGNQ